ncbi:hypothetical protein RJ639_039305 [Escallonia herrerae]|uniref:Glycosyl transferase CAP10 domain-containing protein n=1 Tax=Escallonia herrerae TaxID=1293975 RepID=A0AA88WZ36_9ASTE|nr:hypothetical protein RJ639_039305 [Escallonia herrerae]
MELTKFFSKSSVKAPKKGPLTTATFLLVVIFIAAYTATSWLDVLTVPLVMPCLISQNALHNALGHEPQQQYEYPASLISQVSGEERCFGGENVTEAPPIFHYCGDDETLDVVVLLSGDDGDDNGGDNEDEEEEEEEGDRDVEEVMMIPIDTIEGNEIFFAEAVSKIKEGMKEVMISRDTCEGDDMVFPEAVTEILKKPPILAIGAVEVCLETLARYVTGVEKDSEMESMVKSPADTGPCTMPPPYQPEALGSFVERKSKSYKASRDVGNKWECRRVLN